MQAMLLNSMTGSEWLEVAVTGVLITVAMGVMVALAFAAQFFVDDVRPPED
jgi:hypothetical protein